MYLTRAGTRCGSCIPTIRAILEQVTASGVDSTKRRLNVVYDDVVTTAA